MQHIRAKSAGFTLVEVLVISPIIILFIGSFIALLVNLTGESLVARERNLTVHDTQAALDQIQTDIGSATGFLATTASTPTLRAPQGVNDTSTDFTDTAGDTLILTQPATTKSQGDNSRELIYTGSGTCDAKNPVYKYMTVYFTALDLDTADPTDKALYKRIIIPQVSACKEPKQTGTCRKDAIDTNNKTWCRRIDEKLLGGVSSFTYQYLDSAGATTTAANAIDASINVAVAKKVAGSDVNYSSNVKTNASNTQTYNPTIDSPGGNVANTSNTSTTPPPNSPIQTSRSDAEPYKTKVLWDRIGNATGGYTAKYRIGGGTEQSVSIPQTTEGNAPTFTTIDALYRKQTVQLTELKVKTTSGDIDYGTMPNIANIPAWNECQLVTNTSAGESSWYNYGSVYNTMGFTRTSSGVVGLKGLVQGGQIGNEARKAICILPSGFRPTEHIIVQQPATYGAGDSAARVDVFPDGRVQATVTPYGGSGLSQGWVSLDGLMFITANSNPSWTNNSYNSSWYFNNYNDGYGSLKSWKDTLGRTWVQGIATGGSQNNVMSYLPTAHAPDGGMHYPMYSDSAPNAVNFMPSGDNRMLSRASGSYLGTNAVFYASTGGKYALPLYNGWYNYGSVWTTAQCFKGADDIVILQGLVAGGNPAAGGLTNISGCAGGASASMSTGKNAILGGVAYPGGAGVDRAYRIDLVTDNYMYPYGGGANGGWTSLDGIHYIAN